MRNKKETSKITKENYLTCYIIKGNKQILKVFVKASKKFIIGLDTYIIKNNRIYTKIVNGKLISCSFYSEGNPYPHSFIELNIGVPYKEFNDIYGEELYDMLIKLQSERKLFYMLLLNCVVMALSLITLLSEIFT